MSAPATNGTMALALEPSQLTIVPATPAQAGLVRSNTIEHFGKWDKCTPEEWAQQDEQVQVDESGRSVKRMTVWLLVPRSSLLPTTPVMTSSATLSEIYTHFETYRIPGLLSTPSTSSTVSSITTYSIGTVWTPPLHRRKGYARLALQLAHYVMSRPEYLPPFPEKWGERPPVILGDATCSTLHSDVGIKYYQTCTIGEAKPGWREQGSVITEWELEDSQGEENELKDWEWITSLTKLRKLGEYAMKATTEMFEQSVHSDERTQVVILPTGGTLAAHHNRSLLRLPFPDDALPSRPTTLAAYNAETRSLLVFCPTNGAVVYPPFERKGKTLEISYVFGDVPWSVVRGAARREGCKRVEVWGTEGAAPHWPGGKMIERGDLYSMIAYYGPLSEGEDKPLWARNGMWTPCRTWNFESALRERDYAQPYI